MPTLVADSSSLILLAKCTLLEILADLFSILVPQGVMDEAITPELLMKYPDAKIIYQLVSLRKIEIAQVEPISLNLEIAMHKGELDALILAKKSTGSILATDDGKAIKACRFLNIPFIITPKIVLELFRLDKITYEKAKEALEKLRIIGRYSPDIIAEAFLKLMEENHAKANNNKSS